MISSDALNKLYRKMHLASHYREALNMFVADKGKVVPTQSLLGRGCLHNASDM